MTPPGTRNFRWALRRSKTQFFFGFIPTCVKTRQGICNFAHAESRSLILPSLPAGGSAVCTYIMETWETGREIDCCRRVVKRVFGVPIRGAQWPIRAEKKTSSIRVPWAFIARSASWKTLLINLAKPCKTYRAYTGYMIYRHRQLIMGLGESRSRRRTSHLQRVHFGRATPNIFHPPSRFSPRNRANFWLPVAPIFDIIKSLVAAVFTQKCRFSPGVSFKLGAVVCYFNGDGNDPDSDPRERFKQIAPFLKEKPNFSTHCTRETLPFIDIFVASKAFSNRNYAAISLFT